MKSRRTWIVWTILAIAIVILGLFEKFSSLSFTERNLVLSIEPDSDVVEAMRILSLLGSVYVVLPVVLLLYALKRNKYTLTVLLSIIAGEALVLILKIAFSAPRPGGDFFLYGYPSGHSTRTTLIAVWAEQKYLRISLVLLAISVMVSRILLHAHDFGDLAGGILLGFLVKGVFDQTFQKAGS